ncbi:MAG: DUF86 domain-containing protein [Alicyclobacillaceae bacterium]|nr:DUF86 domain-containing protein [Alicyclobacillaceae bacterium]
MFVTDELRGKVNRLLLALEERARWLEELANRTDTWWTDPGLRWGAERALQVAAELTTDAANAVIDALVMREPGSYADIVRVLWEEGVISQDLLARLDTVVSWRNRLVRHYAELEPEDVRDGIKQCSGAFDPFAAALRAYLGMR